MRYVLSLTVLLGACALAAARPAATTGPTRRPATRPATGPATAPSTIRDDLLRGLTEDLGSIAIRVVQGTAGGADVVGLPVTVELIESGKGDAEPTVIETRVDEHGIAMVEDLPLEMPFTPRVRVEHGGMPFEVEGEIMHAANPEQTFTVTVYESTEETPAWEVTMRQVELAPSPHGLYVTESLKVNNPSDRAWLSPAGVSGMRASVVLPLPAGAKVDQMGGALHACCAKIIGGRIHHSDALLPGESAFTYRYVLPSGTESVTVGLVASAPVKEMVVMAPHRGDISLQAEGMVAGRIVVHRGKPVNTFRAVDLPLGAKVSVTVSSAALAGEGAAESEDEEAPDGWGFAKTGGIILLVAGVVVLLIALRGKAMKADQG